MVDHKLMNFKFLKIDQNFEVENCRTDNIDNILTKSEEKINSENLVRKAIKEGIDPQEAYKKYSAF